MKKTLEFETMLRKGRLKCTAPRLAVMSVLAGKEHYLSAREIHARLDKKKGIDLVTVYRTLASFEKAGIVKRVDTRKESVCYELNDGHHHHVICTNCEKMAEFTESGDDVLIAKALKQVKGFSSISSHSFDLFGLCDTCAKK